MLTTIVVICLFVVAFFIPGTHQAKRENLRKGIQPFRGTPAVNYCVGSCSWSNMASD